MCQGCMKSGVGYSRLEGTLKHETAGFCSYVGTVMIAGVLAAGEYNVGCLYALLCLLDPSCAGCLLLVPSTRRYVTWNLQLPSDMPSVLLYPVREHLSLTHSQARGHPTTTQTSTQHRHTSTTQISSITPPPIPTSGVQTTKPNKKPIQQRSP